MKPAHLRRHLTVGCAAVALAACGGATAAVDEGGGGATVVVAAPASRGAGARAVEMSVPQPAALAAPQLARSALDRALAAGPGWLLGQVPLEPVRGKDRQFLGFRVVSVFADDPRALAYGVLPGDLLVRIQGQRIVTPGDLMTVFQRLRGAAEIVVELQRGREPLTLRWPVVDPGQNEPAP